MEQVLEGEPIQPCGDILKPNSAHFDSIVRNRELTTTSPRPMDEEETTIPPASAAAYDNSATVDSSQNSLRDTAEDTVEPVAQKDDVDASKEAPSAGTTSADKSHTASLPQGNPQPCLYKVGRELGKGTYSVVKEAEHIETKKYYAAKIINKRLMTGREHLVKNEIVVLRRLSKGHPNILTLVDYFETDNNLYLITELAKGGELFDRIYARGSFYESDAAKLVREITSGVAYLHKHGIVHRDLKPENLLFKSPSESSRLLIADFGLSRIIDEEKLKLLTTTCGTPSYMAPEIFGKSGHAKPVDIWAIGVITYFLLCGYTPFDRDTPAEERKAILSGDFSFEPEEVWIHVSGNAVRFIRGCLCSNPSERMTAEQCLEHPFLTKTYRKEPDLLPTLMSNLNMRNNGTPSTLEGRAMQGLYSVSPESSQ